MGVGCCALGRGHIRRTTLRDTPKLRDSCEIPLSPPQAPIFSKKGALPRKSLILLHGSGPVSQAPGSKIEIFGLDSTSKLAIPDPGHATFQIRRTSDQIRYTRYQKWVSLNRGAPPPLGRSRSRSDRARRPSRRRRRPLKQFFPSCPDHVPQLCLWIRPTTTS